MFRKLLLAAAIVLAPSAAAQQPLAAEFARNMQGAVGQTFEGGVKLVSVTNEENVLVLTVDGPEGWRAAFTPQIISDALLVGFCGAAPDFFSTGVTMRVDSLDVGALIKGPDVNECPATTAG